MKERFSTSTNSYEKYWDKICQIYLLTKHYLLLAEEISDDFDTFLQPLKEHRDVLDHLVKVYGYEFLDDLPSDPNQYCESNMRKALGHAYRAFFDTADWLSYKCRMKIYKTLDGKKYEDICSKYPKYPELKENLRSLPERIAKIRESKDIGMNENGLIQEVDNYSKILDMLIDGYNQVIKFF